MGQPQAQVQRANYHNKVEAAILSLLTEVKGMTKGRSILYHGFGLGHTTPTS